MPSDLPKKIVITPVRNEAWVLEAFLTHCSSWADHIILADQHSTDGSREIASRFPKVTLVDNPTDEWIEYLCRIRLLEEVQKIPGDKIIFALDADEFLSSGFQNTSGWKRIMTSEPNEIFCFRWLNLYGDFSHGQVEGVGAEWVAHFAADIDIVREYRLREKHAVHCQRVPCLEIQPCRYTLIEDILFVHLGAMSRRRMRNKLDFYQVVNIDKNPENANPLSMYRSYTKAVNRIAPQLDQPVRITTADNTDITSLIHSADPGNHFIDETATILQREGYQKFNRLSIWDNPDLQRKGIIHKPPFAIRIIHNYLHITQRYCNTIPVTVADKVVKKILST